MFELPTGSLITILGVPCSSEDRYLDPPVNRLRRADAWSWTCGCAAEPHSPGRFQALPCEQHREILERRSARRSATAAYGRQLGTSAHVAE
jgi:hypothetical protein